MRFREPFNGRDARFNGYILEYRQAHVRAIPKALECGRHPGRGKS